MALLSLHGSAAGHARSAMHHSFYLGSRLFQPPSVCHRLGLWPPTRTVRAQAALFGKPAALRGLAWHRFRSYIYYPVGRAQHAGHNGRACRPSRNSGPCVYFPRVTCELSRARSFTKLLLSTYVRRRSAVGVLLACVTHYSTIIRSFVRPFVPALQKQCRRRRRNAGEHCHTSNHPLTAPQLNCAARGERAALPSRFHARNAILLRRMPSFTEE